MSRRWVSAIPREMFMAANSSPQLLGDVKSFRACVPIMHDGVVAGFCTPHADAMGWRLTPLWIDPAYRRLGLARRAWDAYRDRVCVAFIRHDNPASERLHIACGFEPWRRAGTGTHYRRMPCASPS